MAKDLKLEEVLKVLTPPFYILGSNGVSETVDKVTPIADGGMARERYLVTARQQCTCIGFMKAGKCKHIAMLNGEYEGRGTMKEAVIEVICRLQPLIDPAGVPHPQFFADEMPDTITSIKVKATTIKGKKIVVVSKVKVASTDFMLYIHCNE